MCIGVAIGLSFIGSSPPKPKQPPAIEWLDNPRAIEPFSLQSESGEFTNQSLKGQWTFVLFGFLHCPDICPTSMAQLSTLTSMPIENTQFVFVSVDPERDSLGQIGEYTRHFDESIMGVTGEHTQLTQFANDLGIQYKVTNDPDDYTVAHSLTYSIIGPEGNLQGRFRPGFDSNVVVQEFTAFALASSKN